MENTHFLLDYSTMAQAVEKHIVSNVSDISSMGGIPMIAFLGLGLNRHWNEDQRNALIDAFEIIKKGNSKIKLAIAGAPAWKYEEVFEKISQSSFKEDIVITDTMPFEHLPAFYQNALIFIFPSLYEGFGIPILEAMASGVPVISAKNSSIPEVAGNAALFFDAENPVALAENIEKIIAYDDKRKELIEKGFKQAQKFSWRKCAEETLKVLLDARKNR